MNTYAIVAYDKLDGQAAARRQAARTPHFERMKLAVGEGKIHFAGSMLAEDGRMTCSIVIASFPDRAALDAWVREEPYVKNGAWERIEVAPMFVAVKEGVITDEWMSLMARHLAASAKA
ncbi:YciI family protein [Roseicella sp. DB1501]|uniref:YciI family protein n=1 Tax=Roseicella sp. DB1501 TaxID=2730925 RepID=UPI00149165BE|nr:YciI family protein [Roseicella sp. DB1501]NOG70522.1 hypothetical protein [Roseicella sp. DB1501]